MTKRIFDVVIAGGLLLLIVPLLIAIAVLVWLSSPGPIIFSQKRLGLKGVPFTILKFRSMFNGSSLDVVVNRRDPRITPIGRLLRKTHLDELPQLWNVLMGQMSLVGPRPVTDDFARQYESEIVSHYKRLTVKPGITGLSQLRGRLGRTRRQSYFLDQYYIRHQSLILDVCILWRTIVVMCKGTGV